MYSRRAISKLLGVACMIPLAAHANLLTNESFELGDFVNQGNVTMVLPVGSTAISGWTVINDQLAWIDTGNAWGLSAQDGDRFLDLTAYPTGAPFGGVSQAITISYGVGGWHQPNLHHLDGQHRLHLNSLLHALYSDFTEHDNLINRFSRISIHWPR